MWERSCWRKMERPSPGGSSVAPRACQKLSEAWDTSSLVRVVGLFIF